MFSGYHLAGRRQVTVDYYYVNSGLSGDFFLPGWTWQLNASYSLSDGDYKQRRF